MYLSACSDKAARYVNDSSDYTSFGIDLHDIDSVIANNTKSLLQSSYVKEMKSKKLLAISNIINQTHEDIDMEFVSRSLCALFVKVINLPLQMLLQEVAQPQSR